MITKFVQVQAMVSKDENSSRKVEKGEEYREVLGGLYMLKMVS